MLVGSQSGGSSLPLRENKLDAGSESKDTCGKADVKTKNMADMCQANKNTMETLSFFLSLDSAHESSWSHHGDQVVFPQTPKVNSEVTI